MAGTSFLGGRGYTTILPWIPYYGRKNYEDYGLSGFDIDIIVLRVMILLSILII